MADGISIFFVIFGVIVISLHTSGARFLIKTTLSINENIELLSLSLASCIYYSYGIVRILLPKSNVAFGDLPRPFKYMVGFFNTFMIPLLSAMVFLTLQRFFAVWYHLRYETSWIFRKRTQLVAASWIIAGIAFVLTSILDVLQGSKSAIWIIYARVIGVTGVTVTNLTFIPAYTYIYYKYRQTRLQDATRRSIYANRRAKLFTPFLVCFSFFIFGSIPSFFRVAGVDVDLYIIHFGTFLDGICNSMVYVFLNERFVSWFRRWKNRNRIFARNRNAASVNETGV